MAYLILQQELDPPDKELYRQALVESGVFVRADIAIMTRHMTGILARGLSQPSAQAVQAAMASHNIVSQIVEQSKVLPLPPHKRTIRLGYNDKALLVQDPLGEMTETPWAEVAVLAAGKVNRTEEQAREVDLPDTPDGYSLRMRDPRSIGQYMLNSLPFAHYVDRQLCLLEVVTHAMRYQMLRDEANYAVLGERAGANSEQNFAILLGEMHALAKDAWLNSGAASLLHQPPQNVLYDSERLFDDELAWLLWKSGRKNDHEQ